MSSSRNLEVNDRRYGRETVGTGHQRWTGPQMNRLHHDTLGWLVCDDGDGVWLLMMR